MHPIMLYPICGPKLDSASNGASYVVLLKSKSVSETLRVLLEVMQQVAVRTNLKSEYGGLPQSRERLQPVFSQHDIIFFAEFKQWCYVVDNH